MDKTTVASKSGNSSRFDEQPQPRASGYQSEIDPNVIGILAGGLIIFSYALGYMFFERPGRGQASWMEILCIPTFVSTEVALLLGVAFSVGLAVKMYGETCRFWTKNDDLSSYKMSIFNVLAIRHKHLAQLWFTIALAIFLGGLMYAAFHVMEHSCKKDFWNRVESVALDVHYQPGKNNNSEVSDPDWAGVLAVALPNIFLYSIFFVAWGWALRNYRAHWHNFVTNEHRYASLRAIDRIREDASYSVANQLDLQQAVVVLIPSESAYLEGEGDKEVSAGERLVKVEEAVRGLMAHGK